MNVNTVHALIDIADRIAYLALETDERRARKLEGLADQLRRLVDAEERGAAA